MKKRHYLSLLLLAPVIAYFAGPRPSPDTTIRPLDLPDDLDQYLRQRDSRFDDITPGAEHRIVWNDAAQTKTSLSIVYIHGFSATRQETAPLCDSVARALGANLYYPRLTGHGRPGAALRDATVNDWLNDVAEAVEIGRRLGERVILVGTSTGATLSTWLLMQPELRRDVVAHVMISPNFAVADKNARIALWPWGRQILRAALGETRSWEPTNELHARYWTTEYPVDAIVTLMSLVDLVDDADLSTMTTPTLVMYSEADQVIDVEMIKRRFKDLGSSDKQLLRVEAEADTDNHVLAGDIVAPKRTGRLATQIEDFVRQVLGTGNMTNTASM